MLLFPCARELATGLTRGHKLAIRRGFPHHPARGTAVTPRREGRSARGSSREVTADADSAFRTATQRERSGADKHCLNRHQINKSEPGACPRFFFDVTLG